MEYESSHHTEIYVDDLDKTWSSCNYLLQRLDYSIFYNGKIELVLNQFLNIVFMKCQKDIVRIEYIAIK